MSDLFEALSESSAIADGLADNKAKNFAYTQEAYDNNDVDGVATFDFTKGQNIPDTAHVELADTVANKGARAQMVSLPRGMINHFFGRLSYNLNKVTDILKLILPLFKRVVASGGNRYDPTAEYQQFDEVTFVDTHDAIDSVPKLKSFKRKSSTPTVISGIPPIDSNGNVNNTHWQECYAQISHLLDTAVHGATSANTGSRIVARDANGDFAARKITASEFIGALTGHASSASDSAKLGGYSPSTGSEMTGVIPVRRKIQVSNGDDFNNYIYPDVVYVGFGDKSINNEPFTNFNGIAWCIGEDTGKSQYAMRYDGTLYRRTKWGANWSSWRGTWDDTVHPTSLAGYGITDAISGDDSYGCKAVTSGSFTEGATKSGFYLFAGQSVYDMPNTTEWWVGVVSMVNSGAGSAELVGLISGMRCSRKMSSGTWSAWVVGWDANIHPTTIAGYGITDAGLNSELARVFCVKGDNIPQFPDNVAGTVCTNTGWTPNQCTLSMSGSVLLLTSTGIDPFISRAVSMSGSANRFIRIVFYSPVEDQLQIYYATGSHGHDGNYQKTVAINAGENVLDIDMANLTVGGNDWVSNTITSIRLDFGGVSGVTYIVHGIYIGSGLYDTPVYGLDGISIWENHGVVPVNGKRGKAMLFQGAQYLWIDQPIFGISGVIAFRLLNNAKNTYEHIAGQNVFSANTGVSFDIQNSNSLHFVYGNGSSVPDVTLATIPVGEEHDWVINYTPTTVGPVYKDGVKVFAQTALSGTIKPYTGACVIGTALWNLAESINGSFNDIQYHSSTWSADDAMRYHNGDDPVDCQQKSATGAPNSLAVYGSDGGLKAHGGATVWDASSHPTTLAGYGITDAISSSTQAADGFVVPKQPVLMQGGQVGFPKSVTNLGYGNPARLDGNTIAVFDENTRYLRRLVFNGSNFVETGSLFINEIHAYITALNSTTIAFIGSAQTLRTYTYANGTFTQVGSSLSIGCDYAVLCTLNSTDIAFIDNTNDSLRCYRWNGSVWSFVGNELHIGSYNWHNITALNANYIVHITSDNSNTYIRLISWNGSSFAQVYSLQLSGSAVFRSVAAINGNDVMVYLGDQAVALYRWNGSLLYQAGTINVSGMGGWSAMVGMNNTDFVLHRTNNATINMMRMM